VSPTTIADAERGLERLDALARRFSLPKLADESLVRVSDHLFTGAAAQLAEAVATVMDDDLNTPVAVAELFEALSQANSLADNNKPDEARDLAVAIAVHFAAMGLALDGAGDDIDPESAALVSARDAARAERDWAKADQLRDELVALGWVVEDAATGTKIRRS
jgi:cysteinyl-tRNA synthetase